MCLMQGRKIFRPYCFRKKPDKPGWRPFAGRLLPHKEDKL
jgi:hypothetical protein